MWPWPGDSTLDRARRVAQSYRQALEDRDPNACHQLDSQFEKMGETWMSPRILTLSTDDWVTVDEAAGLVEVTAQAVYQWVKAERIRHVVGTDRRIRVIVADLLMVQREQRQRRATRAS